MKPMPDKPETPFPGWEQVGDLWFHKAPSSTIEEFASGQRGFVSVNKEAGRYVTSGLAGEFIHAGLDDAIAAAERMMASLVESQPGSFLRQSGLDPDCWEFCHEGRFVWFAARRFDGRLERYGRTQWVVHLDNRRIGIASSPVGGAILIENERQRRQGDPV